MWLFWGLKDGSANLGFILAKKSARYYQLPYNSTVWDAPLGRVYASHVNLTNRYIGSNDFGNTSVLTVASSFHFSLLEEGQHPNCWNYRWSRSWNSVLNYNSRLILSWRRSHNQLNDCKRVPPCNSKLKLSWRRSHNHSFYQLNYDCAKSDLNYLRMRLKVRPVEPITRIVWVAIKWFWPENLITAVEKWYTL